jgi:hypothetical protein
MKFSFTQEKWFWDLAMGVVTNSRGELNPRRMQRAASEHKIEKDLLGRYVAAGQVALRAALDRVIAKEQAVPAQVFLPQILLENKLVSFDEASELFEVAAQGATESAQRKVDELRQRLHATSAPAA